MFILFLQFVGCAPFCVLVGTRCGVKVVWLVGVTPTVDCSGIYQPRYADMGLTPVLRLLAQVLQLVIGASYRYIIRVPHAPKRIEILESLE